MICYGLARNIINWYTLDFAYFSDASTQFRHSNQLKDGNISNEKNDIPSPETRYR